MDATLLLYPALAMFALTFMMIMTLGISRFIAIKHKQVNIRFYKHYNEGSQPERLHLLSRHVQNHFEVPPLFYIAIILIYLTDNVTLGAVFAAWSFVILRCLHSFIHLGSNNVSRRFFCFAGSLMSLLVLWLSLFIPLLLK